MGLHKTYYKIFASITVQHQGRLRTSWTSLPQRPGCGCRGAAMVAVVAVVVTMAVVLALAAVMVLCEGVVVAVMVAFMSDRRILKCMCTGRNQIYLRSLRFKRRRWFRDIFFWATAGSKSNRDVFGTIQKLTSRALFERSGHHKAGFLSLVIKTRKSK